MNNDDKNSNWREIHQQLFSPAITPVAHRRRRFATLKRLGVIFSAVVIIAGLVGTVIYLRQNSHTFAPYAQKQHKTNIEFFSDGQLTSTFFKEKFPDLSHKALLTIDIAAIQSQLLSNPQILSATVERSFPNTLKVTLRERRAMALIKLKLQGKAQTFYLGEDGEFFTADDYRSTYTLPYISKANLKHKDSHINSIGEANLISQILTGIQEQFGMYNAMVKSIDLSQWTFPATPTTALTLNLRSGTTLRFAPTEIERQLGRLKETVALMEEERTDLSRKLIDLTYPDKVAIVGLP